MNVLSVKKAVVFYIETDEPDYLYNNYIRDEYGIWRYLRSYEEANFHKQELLEKAYIDYVERTFNGCA